MAGGRPPELRGAALKLLLDTHVLFWSLADRASLGPKALALLKDPEHQVLFSIVSLWELLIKARTGKLDVDHRSVAAEAEAAGFSALGVELRHLDSLADLAKHHGDPFDHLLIAQAIAEEAAFMTSDRMARRYPLSIIAAQS